MASIPEEYICHICKGIMKEAVIGHICKGIMNEAVSGPCIHSFCRICVEKQLLKIDTNLTKETEFRFICPAQKCEIKISGSMDNFPPNWTLRYSIEKFLSEQEGKKKKFCPKHPQQELCMFCKPCKVEICLMDIGEHTRDRHEVVTIMEAKAGFLNKLKQIDELCGKTIEEKFKQLKVFQKASEIRENTSENVGITISKINESLEKVTNEILSLSLKQELNLSNEMQSKASTLSTSIQTLKQLRKIIKQHLETENISLMELHLISEYGEFLVSKGNSNERSTAVVPKGDGISFDEISKELIIRQCAELSGLNSKYSFKATILPHGINIHVLCKLNSEK